MSDNKEKASASLKCQKPKLDPLKRSESCRLRKPPEVKQTLTSRLRLSKANPLVEIQTNSAELENLKKSLQSINSSDENSKKEFQPLKRSQIRSQHSSATNHSTEKASLPKEIKQKVTTVKDRKTRPHDGINRSEFLSSTKINDRPNPMKQTKKNIKKDEKNSVKCRVNKIDEEKDKNKPIRRSLSAQHIDRKKGKNNIDPSQCYKKTLDTSLSLGDLRCIKSVYSPIHEKTVSDNKIFKSPLAQRRSLVTRTPSSVSSGLRRSKTPVSVSTITLMDWERRLNEWLKRRNKSLGTYHYLRQFNSHPKQITCNNFNNFDDSDEDKENKETDIIDSGSYEDLKIDNASGKVENIDSLKIAKEAVGDILKLLAEGYSSEQCDWWLAHTCEKYTQLREEPVYWECRAAIEEARGNFSSAVGCYKTAVIQGAEVDFVDQSLDNLLKKFSLLNISSEHNPKIAPDHARLMKEARDVFKSSIIKFAVQEKSLKSKSEGAEKKTVVITPVRRSTRISRCGYTSTPGVKICSSMQDVDDLVKDKMTFHCNNALF